MTSFRGRQSGKHARTWDDRDRRSMLLNIGFGVTIVAALLLLVIAFAASWYDDNLAPAGSVNGQTITKDEYNRQLAINNFRIDYAQRRIRTLLTAGRIRADDAQALQQTYAEIDRLETTPRADVRYTDYEDLYPWLLLPAAVALALELLLRRGPLLEFAS